jgi:hypothetical protein
MDSPDQHPLGNYVSIRLRSRAKSDSEPCSSWTFAGSTEAYPRDDFLCSPSADGRQDGSSPEPDLYYGST